METPILENLFQNIFHGFRNFIFNLILEKNVFYKFQKTYSE